MNTKIECNKGILDFLLFSYFEITVEDVKDPTVQEEMLKKVIRCAYRDAARHVLKLNDKQKKDGKNLKAAAMAMISDAVKQLSETISYDTWHENLCRVLREKYTEGVMFYGIAQKWVNMTMKYLYLLYGVIPNFKYSEIAYERRAELHVPVDSYIIEAVWEEGIILPIKREKLCKGGKRGAYNSEKVVVWSTWDKNEYDDFRSSLNEKMQFTEERPPLEWENKVWLKAVKRRKNQEEIRCAKKNVDGEKS